MNAINELEEPTEMESMDKSAPEDYFRTQQLSQIDKSEESSNYFYDEQIE